MRTPSQIITVTMLAIWTGIAGAQVFQPEPRFRHLEGLEKLDAKPLRQLAESGNTEAMFLYAVKHMTQRLHETTNMTEIVNWFRRAADRGHGEAQAYMAAQAIVGFDGEVDEPEALTWARKSADAGSLNGAFMLAHFYCGGVGNPRDPDDEPAAILERIAAKGHGMALALVADRMLRDKTAPLDGVRAWDMAVKATENGGSTSIIATMEWGHRQMAKPPADALGKYVWARDRAEIDNPLALHLMGVTFLAGEVTPVDYAKAVGWFQKAADSGHVAAWERLGYLHEKGLGVPKDLEKAAACYQKAASNVPAANEALKRLGKGSSAASNSSTSKP